MMPFYERENITIYCGDCLEIMPQLEGLFDACITDPPYGIDFKYDQHDDDPAEYAEFMRQFLDITATKMIENAPYFIWQAMPQAPNWHKWLPDNYRIFAACKGFVQFRPTPIQFSWDPVIFWGEVKNDPSVYQKDYHEQRKAPFGAGRKRINHPCPRPLEQVEYIVNLGTQRDDLILDPFMGSGTTLVAAWHEGRRAVGIDISEEYCQVAVDRLKPPGFLALVSDKGVADKQLSLLETGG